MSFELSQRSLDRLEGVEDTLVVVVKRAIELTKVDFGVSEGVRSIERQKELVEKGASKTMKSKHIDDIGTWQGKMEDAMTTYIDLRRSQGKRPFIDGPHFELM